MSEIESIPEEEKPEEPEAKEEEALEEATHEAEALVEDKHRFEEAEALEEMITVLAGDITPAPIPVTDEKSVKRPQIEDDLERIPNSTPLTDLPELEADEMGDVGKDEEEDKGKDEEDKQEEKDEQDLEEQADM